SAASTVLSYEVDNLAIDLGAGTASVHGSGVSDKLLGFGPSNPLASFANLIVLGNNDTAVAGIGQALLTAAGNNDTLISGTGSDTLIATGSYDTLVSDVSGNTLQAAQTAVATVALYTGNDASIDLGAGTATSARSTASDTLVG